jgi:hypothetical protein
VQRDGTFSSFYTSNQYVNPGLNISNIGSVGLPLASRDAIAIAGTCRKAPFGRRGETGVDEHLRRTWELDATEFQCRNSAWSSYLQSLIGHAVANLGVRVSASAQRYELLLYEEGAFFKPHRDTEKAPGVFGTLVICLTSEHTGGEVLLVHDNKQRKLETAASSPFDLAALAWYSDVQHEIKPFT